VLYDAVRERVIPETSIIIEYVQHHYPGPVSLLPSNTDDELNARLWDRFFDLYVGIPMQRIVTDRLRAEDGKDPLGVADARQTLDMAYAMIDAQGMSAKGPGCVKTPADDSFAACFGGGTDGRIY
jgi:glutathione S-transferase